MPPPEDDGPYLLVGEAARAALARGIDRMTALLRLTLGPIPRVVAVERLVGGNGPEILDSAATVARRTIQLADPFADMGAMLVRSMVGQVFERAGDGTATAAVIARAVVHEAARSIAAGISPPALRRGIERGVAAAGQELRRLARPVDGPEALAGVARAVLGDEKLAAMVGEVVDAVGPDGAVLVDEAQATEVTYDYVDGQRWDAGFASPHFLDAGQAVARLLEPRVFVTDVVLERAEQLLPLLEVCVAAEERRLLIVAPEVRDAAVALLLVNRQQGVLEQVLAVQAPSIGAQRTRILEDIAVATGGRCLVAEAGGRPEEVTPGDLGSARQAWASRRTFAILGGRGSREAIRRRIGEAKAELAATDDPTLIRRIRERIGKLAGAAAVVRVGAPTDDAREELKVRIEAAVQSARLGLEQGVVAGGGAALLACGAGLERLDLEGDAAIGARILARALEAPLRTIAANAGRDPSPIVHAARRRGPDWAFDVVRGAWVQAHEVGLVDPLAVALAALKGGASAGGLALTTEALVRRRSWLSKLER